MGRKQFERVTVIGAYPGRKVRAVDQRLTTPIPAGGSIKVDIYASPGTMARVKSMHLEYNAFPSTGGTGKYIGLLTGNMLIWNTQAFANGSNEPLLFHHGYWRTASGYKWPDTTDAQVGMMENLVFLDTVPMSVIFKNDSDASDGGVEKIIGLWLEEEKIV